MLCTKKGRQNQGLRGVSLSPIFRKESVGYYPTPLKLKPRKVLSNSSQFEASPQPSIIRVALLTKENIDLVNTTLSTENLMQMTKIYFGLRPLTGTKRSARTENPLNLKIAEL